MHQKRPKEPAGKLGENLVLKIVTPVTAGIAGILVTILVHSSIYKAESAYQKARFVEFAGDAADRIENRVLTYIQVLRGGVGLFKASNEVEREEWNSYIKGLRVEDHFPGIQGIGFARFLAPDEVEEFSQKVRQEGFPDFKVWPPTDLEIRSSIYFLEPFDFRNQRAFGYDMYSEPVRRAAMNHAMLSGEPAISGKVTLVQETVDDIQAGFLTYLPLYKSMEIPTTEEGRAAEIRGVIYSPFRMNDLMNGLLSRETEKMIHLTIFDVPENEEDERGVLFESEGEVAEDGKFYENRRVELPGRSWMMVARPRPAFNESFESYTSSRIAAVSGVLITALVCFVLHSLRRTERRAILLATSMTKELRESKKEVENLVGSLEDRVAKRTKRLQEINEELESFTFSVTHDLRTPLRSVEGFASIIKSDYGEAIDEDGHELLNRLQTAATRMDEIISDMMSLSSISKKKLGLKSVNLSEIAREVVEEQRSQHVDREVNVEIEEGMTARGDASMLRTVFQNLIENAWKYTRGKEVGNVKIGQTAEGYFFVKDNGAGFNQENAGHAFQLFSRMHSPRDFEGTGIGLATVKKIIQRHQGRTWIETAEGRGTTVFFEIGDSSSHTN